MNQGIASSLKGPGPDKMPNHESSSTKRNKGRGLPFGAPKSHSADFLSTAPASIFTQFTHSARGSPSPGSTVASGGMPPRPFSTSATSLLEGGMSVSASSGSLGGALDVSVNQSTAGHINQTYGASPSPGHGGGSHWGGSNGGSLGDLESKYHMSPSQPGRTLQGEALSSVLSGLVM